MWFDDTVKRLNTDDRGQYLGAFKSDDKILTIQKSGYYKLMTYELSNHFDEDMIYIGKFDENRIISSIYFDASIERFYLKRFKPDDGNTLNKKVDFIGDQPGNYLLTFSLDYRPQLNITYDPKANAKIYDDELVNVEEFIGVKGEKAKGKRLTNHIIQQIEFVEPLPYEEEEEDDAGPESDFSEDENDDLITGEKDDIPEETDEEDENAEEAGGLEKLSKAVKEEKKASAPPKKVKKAEKPGAADKKANDDDDDIAARQMELNF